MHILKFTQNWAMKLDNKKFFTTLRISRPFYKSGDDAIIEMKNKVIGTAKIKTVTVCKINELPNIICLMDTGYDKKETITILQRLYPTANWNVETISIILLEWIKRY